MRTERVEDHSDTVKRSRLQRYSEFASTLGFSACIAESPGALPPQERSEIEGRGFDLNTVQGYIDHLSTLDVRGERAAAMLRDAFNDLLGQLEEQSRLMDAAVPALESDT